MDGEQLYGTKIFPISLWLYRKSRNQDKCGLRIYSRGCFFQLYPETGKYYGIALVKKKRATDAPYLSNKELAFLKWLSHKKWKD